MIVPSIGFLAFAGLAAIVFNLSAAQGWRQAVLLAVNVVFLTSFSHNPVAFLPFAGFLALGYVTIRITRNGARPHLWLGLLLLTLFVFFWLKRYSFIPSDMFLAYSYLLVGLSYVFFRVMHLVIDVHEGSVPNQIGVLSYLNYTLNFTSLVSGPIQRYQDYHRMEEVERLPLDVIVAGRALERIVIGYFKVAIVSMALSTWHTQTIQALAPHMSLPDRVQEAILIAAIYPVYLYFNFSGYTDVVIGVARFFRIVLPENFNLPFSSENFLIFWSRWHITLSSWLKTYVYNPLMMTSVRRITAPAVAPFLGVFAFFVTFFLVGLWHGQTSEFIFFGFLQGGGVSANKLYQIAMARWLGRKGYRDLCARPLYAACARGLTFTWFAFTLFWFWSSWGEMARFAADLGGLAIALAWLAIFVGATIVLAALVGLRAGALGIAWGRARTPVLTSRYLRTAWSTALVVTTAFVVILLNSPAPVIVYKAF